LLRVALLFGLCLAPGGGRADGLASGRFVDCRRFAAEFAGWTCIGCLLSCSAGHFLATIFFIALPENDVTLRRTRHGRPALRAILPRTPAISTTSLRPLACFLLGSTALARHPTPIWFCPPHAPQSRLPLSPPLRCRASTPLFVPPQLGRPTRPSCAAALPRPQTPS